MHTVDRSMFPDEPPTRPAEHVPEATLRLATRVRRLAELARERLLVAPDSDALAAAVADLDEIQNLTAAVLQ